MTRLTISLPENIHQRISNLAIKNNDSMSCIINRLIQVGLHHWFENNATISPVTTTERHCHQLIIQMNALIKNMSIELLKFTQEDFEQLHAAAVNKYNELQDI